MRDTKPLVEVEGRGFGRGSPAGVDPRLGERRRQVARQVAHRRRRRLAMAAAPVVAAVALVVALHSPLLAVRHVAVRGAVHTPAAEVAQVAGLAGHPPLVDVSPAVADRRLQRLPWVARAEVRRRWPDAVSVVVTERRPVAVLSRPGGSAVVDGSGHVLTTAPWYGPVLPHVVTAVVSGAAGSVVAPAVIPALTVAAALPPALRGRVVSISLGRSDGVVLQLGGGLSARLGPPMDLPAKFEALASVLAGAAPGGPAVIDVTIPNLPTVGPASSAG